MGTVILPPLLFPVLAYMASSSWMRKKGFVTLTTGDNIMKLFLLSHQPFGKIYQGLSLLQHILQKSMIKIK
jgi:hypothetical protein